MAAAPITILGIDPGLQVTGWGVICSEGHNLTGIATGIIKTTASASTAARLATIAAGLEDVMAEYAPQEAAVEEIFTNSNAASTQKLGLARGVCLMIPAKAGLLVAEYGANKIKKCVTGYGHADKTQMMYMIKLLLPKLELPRADAADALAVAITHAHLRNQRL